MTIQSDTKLLLKGSFKTCIYAFASVVIVNLTDSQLTLYTILWFKHLLFQSTTLILILESRYWIKWAKADNRFFPNGSDNVEK